jgi:triosephosphate isomerase
VEAIATVNPDVKVLCGAGVKTGEDVSKALYLGTSGVLLSTGVVKAGDPKASLMELAAGLGPT